LQTPLKEDTGGEREDDFVDNYIYCKIILLFNYLLLEILTFMKISLLSCKKQIRNASVLVPPLNGTGNLALDPVFQRLSI
jgi:hypothetical protein